MISNLYRVRGLPLYVALHCQRPTETTLAHSHLIRSTAFHVHHVDLCIDRDTRVGRQRRRVDWLIVEVKEEGRG
jgi:hypothetical protein